MSIEKLPYEIFLNIFTNLSAKERAIAAGVCMTWRDVISYKTFHHDHKFWSKKLYKQLEREKHYVFPSETSNYSPFHVRRMYIRLIHLRNVISTCWKLRLDLKKYFKKRSFKDILCEPSSRRLSQISIEPDDFMISLIVNNQVFIDTVTKSCDEQLLIKWLSDEENKLKIFLALCAAGKIQLLEKYFDELIQIFFQMNEYDCLPLAAAFGGLDVVKWIWNKCPKEQRQDLLSYNQYGSFLNAVEQGQSDVLKWLWEQSDYNQKQTMLMLSNYSAFRMACQGGFMELILWLWEQATPEQRKEIIESEDFNLINSAVYSGNLPIVQWCWEQHTQERQKSTLMNLKLSHLPISDERSCLEVIDWLWTHCSAEEKHNLLPEDSKSYIPRYPIFHKAARYGHLDLIQWLWNVCSPEQRITMLKSRYGSEVFYGFHFAAKKGHLAILEWLWQRFSTEMKQKMLHYQDNFALRSALKKKKITVVQWLWDQFSPNKKRAFLIDQNIFVISIINSVYSRQVTKWILERHEEDQYNSLLAIRYSSLSFEDKKHVAIFKRAAESGNLATIKYFWANNDEKEQYDMLDSDEFYAFFKAAEYEHKEIVQWLWEHASSKQKEKIQSQIKYRKLPESLTQTLSIDIPTVCAPDVGSRSEHIAEQKIEPIAAIDISDYTM